MSRSNYSDECEFLDLYRSNVDRTIAGKRGQAFLREMITALEALPDKRLESEILVEDGKCCAIGAVAIKRGIDVSDVDECYPDQVAARFGISEMMAQEIAYQNDEYGTVNETPEQRYDRMLKWARKQIRETKP